MNLNCVILETSLHRKICNYASGSPHLPHHLVNCSGQAHTQHNSVWGGGQHTGDNGVPHREGQHGVDHEHDEQKEGDLQAQKVTGKHTLYGC